MSENVPTPETREDNYLAAVGGATVDLTPYLPPRTRREKYLYEMAGGEVERPDPISREDHYMIAAIEHGGSGPDPTGTINIDSNGTYDVAAYASAAVEVPGELTDEDLHGVIFWDLDGNPIYRYSLAQIQSMESLPPVPDAPDVEARAYIGSSEWNWTLEELKTANRPADVGPLYHLQDGIAAVLPIEVGAGDTISVTMTNSYASANIDWGDGTSGTIGSSSTQVTIDHVYGTAGHYGLVISGVDGSTSGNWLEISGITPRAVAAAYLGKNEGPSSEGAQAGILRGTYSLKHLSIPGARMLQSANSVVINGSGARAIVIPRNVQAAAGYLVSGCHDVRAACFPAHMSALAGNGVAYADRLTRLCLPTVSSQGSGLAMSTGFLCQAVFWPAGGPAARLAVTGPVLRELVPPLSTGAAVPLKFTDCPSLTRFDVAPGTTSLPGFYFQNCTELAEVTIPASMTSIQAYAINASSLRMLTVMAVTPPELATAINRTSLKAVRIPRGSLTAYSEATNWASLADLFEEVDFT